MAKPTPAANATTTTFQIGSYNPLNETASSDGFTLTADLNDSASTFIIPGTLKMPAPDKTFVESGNIRSPGVAVVRWQYKSRTIDISISIRGASYAAIRSTVSTIVSAIENPPYSIRFAWPGASQYSYFDVTKCAHNLPTDPILWLNKALPHYEIHFECMPGIRGDRVTLSNLAVNPGFEAPAGGGTATTMPVVFTDAFANTNAYAVQAGSVSNDKSYFTDAVFAQGLTVLRYLRLGDASTASAAEVAAFQAGTYVNSPTVGVAGGLTGDSDTAVTFAAASSQRVTVPTTGLPTGGSTSLWWFGRIKFASNPASSQVLFSYGNAATATQALQGVIDSSGRFVGSGISNDTTPGSALTTGAYHSVVVGYNASTNTISTWVDGAAYGTAKTSFTLAVPASPRMTIGCDSNSTPAFFFSGQADEVVFGSGVMTTAIALALHTAATTTPATVSQSMRVSMGGRVSFGSPAWGAIATWQMRIRYYSSLTATFYLHYTDANNSLAVTLSGTALSLVHRIGGVSNTLATTAVTPGNEVPYWLKVTQFPSVSGNPPQVAAQLYLDSNGTVGTQVATVGPVATTDAVTAMTGAPQLEATSGNILGIGGNYSNVHTVSLFGPGGWTLSGKLGSATGTASGAWDGGSSAQGAPTSTTTNCFTSGPVTSFGAARIDAPPAGTLDAKWNLYSGGTPAGTQAIPVKTAGDVMYAAAAIKSSGLGNGATIKLAYAEYDASGASLRSGTLYTFTVSGGAQAAYPASGAAYTNYTAKGTWTTGASCAYVDISVEVADTTAGSANGTVWIDNVLVWDSTNTANGETNMAYHEMRFPNSPAQLLVTGLVGDMEASTYFAFGAYVSSWAAGASNLKFIFGRQAVFQNGGSQTVQLCGNATAFAAAIGGSYTNTLDTSSYGGYYSVGPMSGGVSEFGGWPSARYTPTLPMIGLYHLFGRAQSNQATIGNLTVTAGYLQGVSGSTALGYANESTQLTAFSAANTWTAVDIGQMAVPATAYGGLAGTPYDASTMGYPRILWRDSTGGGSNLTQNWWSAVPVDGSLLIGTYNNPSNSGVTLTSSWIWGFSDPLALSVNSGTAAWRRQLNQGPQASPNNAAGGPGGNSTQFIGINPSCEPYLRIDPTNDGQNSSGTNLIVGHVTDGNAAVMAVSTEVSYSPLYEWPR